MAERWWHLWVGICPDGILSAITACDTPDGPDDIDRTSGVTMATIGCRCEDCVTVIGYAGSWDHQPTDAEIDTVTPPGYWSTDNDVDSLRGA